MNETPAATPWATGGAGEIDVDAHRAGLPFGRDLCLGFLRRFSREWLSRGGLDDRRRWDRLVDEQSDQRQTSEAVGQHVMSPEVERRAAALESLDQGDVPGPAVGVERRGLEQSDELEELAAVARTPQRHRAQMPSGAEVRVFDPSRPRECRWDRQTPAEPRRLLGCGLETGDHLAGRRGRGPSASRPPCEKWRRGRFAMIASMGLRRWVTPRPYRSRRLRRRPIRGSAPGRARRRGCRVRRLRSRRRPRPRARACGACRSSRRRDCR